MNRTVSRGVWIAAAVLLAACGPAASAKPATAPPVITSQADPAMFMITLADGGYRPSTIALNPNQPVMLMVVNRGVRPHQITSPIPVDNVCIDDVASATATPIASDPAGITVTVPAGHEVDISFTPVARGNFDLRADGSNGGDFEVG